MASTITLTKTQGTSVLTHQAVTHPATVKGSAQAVTTKMAITITMYHSSIEATANTNAGTFHVQYSAASSGDEDWADVGKFTAGATTASTEAMTATEAAAETVLAVASTTGFVAGDKLYIQDAGTLADSEWGRCEQIVTDTSIDLVDGLTNGKDSSDVIWNDADIFYFADEVQAKGRVRVIFIHEGGTGANCHVKALMTTLDSVAAS